MTHGGLKWNLRGVNIFYNYVASGTSHIQNIVLHIPDVLVICPKTLKRCPRNINHPRWPQETRKPATEKQIGAKLCHMKKGPSTVVCRAQQWIAGDQKCNISSAFSRKCYTCTTHSWPSSPSVTLKPLGSKKCKNVIKEELSFS